MSSTVAPERSWESPGSSTRTFRIIWRTIISMCLSLMSTPLLAVRLLDFLNQVVVDRRDPANPQDLMGRQRTLSELIPLLDPVAVLAADAGV